MQHRRSPEGLLSVGCVLVLAPAGVFLVSVLFWPDDWFYPGPPEPLAATTSIAMLLTPVGAVGCILCGRAAQRRARQTAGGLVARRGSSIALVTSLGALAAVALVIAAALASLSG